METPRYRPAWPSHRGRSAKSINGGTTASSNAAVDIAPLLDSGRWTGYQKLITALSALAVIFDGFDIQILAFAVPSLMKEWGLGRPAFGPVLALGLVGMAAGSPLAGYCGDRFGRRPTLIGCLTVFGIATLATSLVHSVAALAVLRFVTGVGTGGALPNVSALVAEFAPLRRRPLAVKLTMVCVPLGGMVGGFIAAKVLPAYGWRALYQVGGVLPLAFALLLALLLPESPRFLVQNSRSWPRLQRLLGRMGRPVPEGNAFEDSGERKVAGRASIRELWSADHLRDTAGLWLAFLFCLGSIYLSFGWLPSLLTSQGVGVADASRALAIFNVGGVIGVLVWAGLVTKFGSRGPLLWGAAATAVSALLILFVPATSGGGSTLMLAALALNGLLANAVQTAMYALAAHVYPTAIRASGVAYAAAIGRVGGIFSSIFGAMIIGMGAGAYWGFVAVAMVIAFAGLALVGRHFPGERNAANT
jgi:AAHS family 4-hydroxybenzoate transporter-like MFS transporter